MIDNNLLLSEIILADRLIQNLPVRISEITVLSNEGKKTVVKIK